MSEKHSTPTRAVAYYRMSEAHQQASIPEQKQWAARAAKAHRVEILAEFADEAVAGDVIERRPGLMQLLAYCEAHDVQAVVVWDADRFSRADSIATAALLDVLRRAGAGRLLTNAEGWIDLDDDIDRLLFNIKQDMTRAAYSKCISRNVTRSGIDRARRGLWVAGRPPFGYKIGDDGRLALGDPEHVETVRWIFRRYATSADSCGDICRGLIERGAPAPPPRTRKGQVWGGRWQRGLINDLLACRAYLGDLVWNAHAHGKYSRVSAGEVRPVKGRRGMVRNAAEDHIIVPDAHPALIDRETFDACQKKLAATRRGCPGCRTTPLPGGGDWVLTGLLYCGLCGGRMVGVTERRQYKENRHVYRYYVCKTNQRTSAGTCRKNAVKQEEVVGHVARLIQSSFTDPERLALLKAEVERQAVRQDRDTEADRRRLQARVAELDASIEQGNRNLARLPADLLDGVIASVRQWKEERDGLARELARLDAAREVATDYARQVAAALEQVRHLEETIRDAPPAAVRDALSGLVDRITLDFEYGPPRRNGCRPAILTSLEVRLREEASGLLGDQLSLPARNKV